MQKSARDPLRLAVGQTHFHRSHPLAQMRWRRSHAPCFGPLKPYRQFATDVPHLKRIKTN
jgi:hypothetical protein